MNKPDPSHEEPQDFGDLENQLSRLIPAAPSAAAQRRIGRQLDQLEQHRRERRQMWWRFAPVAAAACLVLGGVAFLQQQMSRPQVAGDPAASSSLASDASSSQKVPAAVPEFSGSAMPISVGGNVATSPEFASPPPIVTGIPADHFLPVSSQEFIRDAKEGRVIELSDDLRAREIHVEYDNAWHWHDPDTQTNIRIYRPREETFLVPIETD
ncbi:MAG: hypothetical protein KDL87_04175 [Verrucomicrobiae bacterium]|nr:hypothetical protein [Verrucomicrobiae bacterium]